MTWVHTLQEQDATGALKERYRADLDDFGIVLEGTRAMSACPDLLLAREAFKRAIWATDRLSVRERRLINLLVADRAGYKY